MAKLTIEPDAAALARGAARRVVALVNAAIARTGSARLCLTGGQTPREMYRLLGSPGDDGVLPVDWSAVDLFWGDERQVPPEHPDSNFGMASAALLQPAAIPLERVHRMRGELPDAAAAAREYDGVVRRFARMPAATFDVMLLGLGADAHIASLFPHSPLLSDVVAVSNGQRDVDRNRDTLAAQARVSGAPTPLAAAVWAAHLNSWRITLTPSALLDSEAILVVTSGAGKSAAVRAALQGPDDREQWPAQLLRMAGERVEWWMDCDAAAALT